MSMRALSTSSRSARKRWWPLFALLGAGGACVLALLPQPQQSEHARSTQKPLVYSVIGSGALANAKPAVKEPTPPPVILKEPVDDPPVASDATALTGTKVRHSSRSRASRTVTHTRRRSLIAEKFSATDATTAARGYFGASATLACDHRKVSLSTPSERPIARVELAPVIGPDGKVEPISSRCRNCSGSATTPSRWRCLPSGRDCRLACKARCQA